MNRTKLIFREISNYFYLKRVIRRESRNLDPANPWIKFKLRSNWIGRIYTVLNLREEDMGEEILVQNWKATEKMKPINEYLEKLDLQEIVFPSIEKVPETRSYLVVYSPLFRHLTLTWIITRMLLILGVIFLIGLSVVHFLL
jgi:hypothetical protein